MCHPIFRPLGPPVHITTFWPLGAAHSRGPCDTCFVCSPWGLICLYFCSLPNCTYILGPPPEMYILYFALRASGHGGPVCPRPMGANI